MTIEWLRDLVIVITGIVVTVFLTFLGIVVFLLYRRLRRILDSIEAASGAIEKIVSITADDILEPLVQIAGIIKGIIQGIGSVSQTFKGGKNNE